MGINNLLVLGAFDIEMLAIFRFDFAVECFHGLQKCIT